MPFDVKAARDAGYSDDEILQHLTQSKPFDVEGALKSGYSKQELVDHLSSASEPQSVSERAKHNLDQNWEGSAHVNRPLGVSIGKAAAGAVGDALPVAGGMLGATVGAAGGPVGSAGGAALGYTGGKGLKQLVSRYANPEEEESPESFARSTLKGAAEQGLLSLGADKVAGLAGRVMGSGGTEAARETLAQAERSNLDPNMFSYAEASGSPFQKVIKKFLNQKTFTGKVLSAQRAKDIGPAIEEAKIATKNQVGQPFDEAVESAADAGQTINTSGIVEAARKLKDRIALEGTELSPAAQKLLNRALKFEAAGPVREGEFLGTEATPYQVRGMQTETSDALRDHNSVPDLKRVAKNLKESTTAADDEFLPAGVREDYRNFKQDFNNKPGSLQSKIIKPSEGGGMGIHTLAFPATNVAAGVSAALDRVPLETKIKMLEAFKNGDVGRWLSQAIRGAQLSDALGDRVRNTAGNDERDAQIYAPR